MSDLDLNYLATESTKEDRDKVKDENLLNAHRENIETILSALDKELQVLPIKAKQITFIPRTLALSLFLFVFSRYWLYF